jgi:hypothetical protein
MSACQDALLLVDQNTVNKEVINIPLSTESVGEHCWHFLSKNEFRHHAPESHYQ